MAEKKSKRQQMLDIVLLSFTTPVEMLEKKYGVSKSTIYRWKGKFEDDGTIDSDVLALRSEAIAPTMVIETNPDVKQVASVNNQDVFTDEVLKLRLEVVKKMRRRVNVEKDLDKLTRTLKVTQDILGELLGDDIDEIKKKSSIFEIAEIIEANKDELLAKRNQLNQNNEESTESES